MGIFDQDIGNINFVPKEGVDLTHAQLIKKYGNIPIEAYKGKVQADLEKQFKLIERARTQKKRSSEWAKAQAANAVADASTRLPGFASDFRKQGAEFFGTFGPGHAAFTQTPDEILQASLVKDLATNMQHAGLDYTKEQDRALFQHMQRANAEAEYWKNQASEEESKGKYFANYLKKSANSSVVEISGALLHQATNELETTGSISKPEMYIARIDNYEQTLLDKASTAGMSPDALDQYKKQLDTRFAPLRDMVTNADFTKIIERDGKRLDEAARQVGSQMFPTYFTLAKISPEFASKFLELQSQYEASPESRRAFFKAMTVGNQFIGADVLEQIYDDPAALNRMMYESFTRIANGRVSGPGDVGVAVDVLRNTKDTQSSWSKPIEDVVATYAPNEMPDSLVQDNLPKWLNSTNQLMTASAISLGQELSKYDKGELALEQNQDGTFKLVGNSYRTQTTLDNFTAVSQGIPYDPITTRGLSRSVGLPAIEVVEQVNDLIRKAKRNGVEDRVIIEPFKHLVDISTIDKKEDRANVISEAFDAFMRAVRQAPKDALKGALEFQNTAAKIQSNPQEALKPAHEDNNNNTSTNYKFIVDENTGMLSTEPQ